MALMNTFRRGNSRHVEPAEFMEWIEQVANVSGATSLHGKAAKYAGLLVESECYETAELLASVTEQQLIAINVPRGHAAVLAYFLSGPPTQGASPSTSHGDSGGTTTTSEATNISGQMIGEIITATTRANKQAKALQSDLSELFPVEGFEKPIFPVLVGLVQSVVGTSFLLGPDLPLWVRCGALAHKPELQRSLGALHRG